jgi:transcription-repair coupling factor (superfamily II helicase)
LQAKLYEYFKEKSEISLLLCRDNKEAAVAADVLGYLGYATHTLPDFRAAYGDDLRAYSEELRALLTTLSGFYRDKKMKKIMIAPFRTIMHDLPKPELFKERKILFGDRLDLQELKESLLFWGYTFVDIVEERGEVSFRGDIIDIYPPNASHPYRISLFDDEVESIRPFFCETQKSQKEELEEVTIQPALFALDAQAYEAINRRIENIESDAFVKDIASLGFWVLEDGATNMLEAYSAIFLQESVEEIEEAFSFSKDTCRKEMLLRIPALPQNRIYKDIEVAEISSFLTYHKNKKITIVANNEAIVKQHNIPELPNVRNRYEP